MKELHNTSLGETFKIRKGKDMIMSKTKSFTFSSMIFVLYNPNHVKYGLIKG